jgi:hypothetical protein
MKSKPREKNNLQASFAVILFKIILRQKWNIIILFTAFLDFLFSSFSVTILGM